MSAPIVASAARTRRTARVVLASWIGLAATGCSPLLATEGRNAVGAHLGAVSVESDLAQDPPEPATLGSANGLRLSYCRNMWGKPSLWLGPEVMAAWPGERQVASVDPAHPASVSSSFAAVVVRTNYYAESEDASGGEGGTLASRLGLSVGGGLAYARYVESDRLADGTVNPSRRTDNAFGPTVTFGVDLRITPNVIVRVDGYLLFFKPSLSFPWPDRVADRFLGGGGLIVAF
jgi:hypothetical protein